MTVYGADAARSAAAGDARLRIGPRDVVTPLAREVAAELGVEIVVSVPQDPPPTTRTVTNRAEGTAAAMPQAHAGTVRRDFAPTFTEPARSAANPPGTPKPVPIKTFAVAGTAPPPLRPPSPALFRRGAPLAPEVLDRPVGSAGERGELKPSGRTGRVVVVGAGHVGMITAMRLAEADLIDEIVLVDIVEGLAAGIALDITHTAALLDFTTRVRGVTSVEEAGPADYVVITAGRPRQPGMSRTDLVTTNAAIVGELARRVAAVSPDAVLVVVTNPLDEMTYQAWRACGFPARRVLGMAGVLDTARLQALVGLTGVDRADRVRAVALGSHGDEMVIPLSQATVAGGPLADRLPPATLTALVDRTRDSGAEVVGLLTSGSAFMAPGTSAAHMVLAMARGSREVVPATVRAEGQYGIRDVFVGLPVRLGRHGVTEIVELDLTAEERAALRSAAERIAERVARLPGPSEPAMARS